jgi:exopolysaccharide biosynthesis protein
MRGFWRILILAAMLIVLAIVVSSPSPTGKAFAGEIAFTPLPWDDSAAPLPNPGNYLPDNAGYEDASISVRIEEFRMFGTAILAAYVTIADPSQIRTSMAGKFGSTADTYGSRIAKRVNAVLAINGDFFNYTNKGYIVRQGTLYRNEPAEGSDVLLIDDRGDFHIIVDATGKKIAAFDGTVVNSFSFGPALVVNGQPMEIDKNKEMATHIPTQRMVIAQSGPLSYVCVATEGPENENAVGLTLEETVELMMSLGVENAYNLDGGSSSTMVLNNAKINALSSNKVRQIWDILYFATLIPAE